jgi:hypothetical protein
MIDNALELKASQAELLIGEITLLEFSELSSKNIILPELIGSEKQIEWADKLRAEWLKAFDEYIALATENVNRLAKKGRDAQGAFDEHAYKINRAIVGCSLICNASTWIQQLKAPSINDISAPFMAYLAAGGEIKDDEIWANFYSAEAA